MSETGNPGFDSVPFSPQEIDRLDVYMQQNMSVEELNAFKNKLNVTLKALKLLQRLTQERIDRVRDMIDETDYLIEDLSE